MSNKTKEDRGKGQGTRGEPDSSTLAPRPSPLVFHVCVLAVTFLIMLAWTWLGWPDPLVDFGRELYVPWQLAQGKVLYRDIAYFNGPFSPYFNSLLFRLFGESLRTIVLANLILLAGLTWMIWRLIEQTSDAMTATVACVVLLTVFSFVQFVGIGNYNFVTPYSHEMTHGIVLSFAAMTCLSRFIDKRRAVFATLTGISLGLVFLTKAEVFLAAALAIGIGLALSKPPVKSLVGFAVGFIAPPIIAIVTMAQAMSLGQALHGVLGSWVYVFDSNIRNMYFYRGIMGTLDLRRNWELCGYACIAYAAVLLPAVLVGWSFKKGAAAACAIATGICIIVFILMRDNLAPWQSSLRGLTIVMPLLSVGTLVFAIRHPRPQRTLRAVLSIFATVLLAKIFFNITPFQYGFALAMPATLIAISAALGWIFTPSPGTPGEAGGEGSGRERGKALTLTLSRNTGRGNMSRALLLPVVGLFIFVHLLAFGRYYAGKPTVVGQGTDMFYADPLSDVRGQAINLMLQSLNRAPASATLAVFPQGATLNYLSRRSNPTSYLSIMPPELMMFGKDKIARACAEHPPDLIVLVLHTDLSEYGYKAFGVDYGQEFLNWIKTNYSEVQSPQDPRFPLLLLARR
ncbi:MAG TPA: glycosyltransferase family 39 protein [Tepidisphaeraceae bacterium]|nr:glycosyltransferase family 39 protein [Tepidisphaeraceae bacterium]